MKCDPDANGVVILSEDLAAQQCCHQGGYALLTIYENAFAGGRRAVLELNGGVAPSDEVANGKPLIERIEKIANFNGLPHEWTLYFGNSNLPRLYPGQQRVDRLWRH